MSVKNFEANCFPLSAKRSIGCPFANTEELTKCFATSAAETPFQMYVSRELGETVSNQQDVSVSSWCADEFAEDVYTDEFQSRVWWEQLQISDVSS